MRVLLNQTKNGLLAFCWRSMKSSAPARNSSSTVSMRFFVSGPVSDLAVGIGMQDSARTETFSECRILRIVDILRLFFGIEVVKIAKELIEAVLGREKFIFVAKMIFSELSGRVTQRFKQFCDRRILRAQADVGAR